MSAADPSAFLGAESLRLERAGVPPCRSWHPALESVARLVSQAACPMVLLVGPAGTLVPNAASLVFFGGAELRHVTGRSVLDVAPAHGDLFARALERAYRGLASRFAEQAVRRGGAETLWFNLEFTPVTDDAGATLGVLCTACDVTDLVAARRPQEAMARDDSPVRFDVLTEALPQIVWSSDAEGRHDYFSRRWSEFTGIAPEEITDEIWKMLVYPGHRAKVLKAWEEARRTGKPYDIDYRFRHRSGEYRWLRVMALPIRDESGQIVRWCGTSTDVHETYLVAAERQRLALELKRIATQDQLTEVLTRRAFFERSAAILGKLARRAKPVSVLMMDIDHFKRVNDTYGHPAGDAVLSAVAGRLRRALKKGDLIGRLGGEEFAVLLPGCCAAAAMETAERLRLSIEGEPVAIAGGLQIPVTLSLGVTTGAVSAGDPDRLLSAADKALYQAKSAGRNRAAYLAPPD